MIRQNKSRRARAANLAAKYLKFKAVSKAAKGVGKTVTSAASGKAKPAQRAPKKAWVALAGVAGATALVARKLRSDSANPSQPTTA